MKIQIFGFAAVICLSQVTFAMELTSRQNEFLATQKILSLVKAYIKTHNGKGDLKLENQIVETPYLGPYSPGTAQGLILRNLTCMSRAEYYDTFSLYTPWGVIPLVKSNQWASLRKEELFPNAHFKKFGHRPIGVAGGRMGSDNHYDFTDETKFEILKLDDYDIPPAVEDETRVSKEIFEEYQQLKAKFDFASTP